MDKPTALRLVQGNPIFATEFYQWLDTNYPIWEKFVSLANQIWDKGRRHYSVWSIIGFIRFHTMLHENGSKYKISNNVTPDLSRLYGLMYPQRPGFFTTVKQKRSKRAA